MGGTGYKAIFFDIDGTLVSFQTHCIPDSTLQAVHRARMQGVKVFICTGRPLPFVDNLGGLEYDGTITFTGANVQLSDGTLIARHSIHPDDVARMVQYLDRHPMPVLFASADDVFGTCRNSVTDAVMQLLNLDMPRIGNAAEALQREILQLIAFFPPENEDAIMDRLLPGCDAKRWHPAFVDIIASGNSKASGIDSVLEHFGIGISESMAFGDGGNDMDMLSHVGLGIAMGNASDEVKACAHFITDTVDNDGVAKALEHFL